MPTKTANTISYDVTDKSLDLFLALAEDAANWSGTPLVDVTPAERGNLTQLKVAGLLTTQQDERGDAFAYFTTAGKNLAAANDIDLSWA